ncbi:TPA: hypothetical protein ACI4HY_003525 [Providencia stuartii]
MRYKSGQRVWACVGVGNVLDVSVSGESGVFMCCRLFQLAISESVHGPE